MRRPEPKFKQMTRVARMTMWARRRARTHPGYHYRKVSKTVHN